MLSNTAIFLKELFAHQLHQLLMGETVDQAKAFPEAPLVFLWRNFFGHGSEQGYEGGLVNTFDATC